MFNDSKFIELIGTLIDPSEELLTGEAMDTLSQLLGSFNDKNNLVALMESVTDGQPSDLANIWKEIKSQYIHLPPEQLKIIGDFTSRFN